MKTIFMKVNNINIPIVCKMTDKKINLQRSLNYSVKSSDGIQIGHSVIIENNKELSARYKNKKAIYSDNCDDFDNINNNDILQINPDGRINILWDSKKNKNNCDLFITHQCNSKCIMCPQPPEKDSYSLLNTNLSILRFLKNQPILKIGISGGEPTLKIDDLTIILRESYKLHPSAQIDLLTNAKALSDFNLAKQLAVENPNVTYCISFPSDNSTDFDMIMNSKNIFSHTTKAIHNLAKLRQKIELRVVIMKDNYERLLEVSEFIYRNFPFTSHITFMGMEITGYAYDNFEKLCVTPPEFEPYLLKAIKFLNQRNMHVSIYNVPLCMINDRLWDFTRDSISSWKKQYLEKCNVCTKKSKCSGLFTTSKLNNYNVKPL